MVLCFIALGVFSILGIFSAKYRAYAKEAFSCVIKKATLRKCDSDLDLRMQSEIVGKLMGINKPLAGFTNRNFAPLSWIFTILMFASFVYSAVSVYNYVAYGNCNGPNSTGFCVFDPEATGENGFSRSGDATSLQYPPTLAGQQKGNENSSTVIIEYGCFSCGYTKAAESTVKTLLEEYKGRVLFVFKLIPIDKHPYSWEAANAAECAADQGKFWEYKDALFANQKEVHDSGIPVLKNLARGMVADLQEFDSCVDSNAHIADINVTYTEGHSIGIYGTPTFFIGNKSFVGNVEYSALRDAVEQELNN